LSNHDLETMVGILVGILTTKPLMLMFTPGRAGRHEQGRIAPLVINKLFVTVYQKHWSMARSHGLVVKGEDSQLSGCGFESWHRILDGFKRC
jgi:hypothetical protein